MAIQAIYSFLTYPKRSYPDDPLAPGTQIPVDVNNKLVRMLEALFQRAPQDCAIPIMFRADDADQMNPVRAELLTLLASSSVESAAPLALRLQRATAGTSGMGLMFICLGEDDGGGKHVLLSRFPADEGVVAERSNAALTVQFVEQVFLKSAHSYKAALFVANGRADQLWNGHIVDRQLNHGSKAVADYWIVDFLVAEFATTAAAGTKRLALALRQAIGSTTDISIKQEIAAAAQLAGNIPNRAMTIAGFCERFNLSDGTKAAVVACIRPPRLVSDRFRFDAEEFARHLAYKQVELDNGAILTAPADRFDEVFERTQRRQQETFSTTGAVVDQRLRKTK
ncbi:hypothetical protein [Hydrogenophaga taeniospiralis]|uniref:hypothetical protein n=1 Tax=Hydrogenophaga taeniospiralis TaxID=65656 RepID=UPI001CF9A829|nr:hypothetical protein [Hydrogenophaga taeniospiralis]UCU95220.1 hypothetical protein KI616_05000 [Hydrogenophaga taeniospiralis]